MLTIKVCVVSVCLSVCTVNLLLVGLVIHHREFILCGVANGSLPCGGDRAGVPWSWSCKPTKGLPMHIVHAVHALNATQGLPSCCLVSRLQSRARLLLRTTLMSLTGLPARWHTGPKFNASNWLLSVPWPPCGPLVSRTRPVTGLARETSGPPGQNSMLLTQRPVPGGVSRVG